MIRCMDIVRNFFENDNELQVNTQTNQVFQFQRLHFVSFDMGTFMGKEQSLIKSKELVYDTFMYSG